MVDPAAVPFIQRLDRNPDDAEALDAVWRLHTERKQFEPLVSLAEKVATRRKNPSTAADLHYRIGKVVEDELRKLERAVVLYTRALELAPRHFLAARALAELHLRRNQYAESAAAYEHAVAAAPTPADQLSVLEDMLELHGQTEDAAGRLLVLRQLCVLKPGDEHRERELARLLNDRIRAGNGDEQDRKDAARTIGRIARTEMAERKIAVAEEALKLWPGDEGAFELLEELAPAPSLTRPRIDFLTSNPDSKLAPMVRKNLASHYARQEKYDSAIEALLPIANTDPDAHNRLAELYRSAGRHGDLATLMGGSVQGHTPPSANVTHMRERAELYRRAGNRLGMLGVFAEIVASDPSDTAAFGELELEYRTRGAARELRDLLALSGQDERVPADVRVTRLWQAAYIGEQQLADPDAALTLWQSLRALDPSHQEATAAIDRLLVRLQRWDELLAFLDARANETTGDTQKAVWLRYLEIHRYHRNDAKAEEALLTKLWEQHPQDDKIAISLADARRRLGDAAGVERVLRRLIETASTENVAARWSQLASYLEYSGRASEALETWRKVRALDSSHAMAWDAEERLLEAEGDWAALLQALLAHANHPIAAGRAAGSLYVRAARVAQKLSDNESAIAHAERALRMAPQDPAVIALLRDLYEATGASERLSQLPAVPISDSSGPAIPRIPTPSTPPPASAPAAEVPAAEPEPDAPSHAGPARIQPPSPIAPPPGAPLPQASTTPAPTPAPSPSMPTAPPLIRPAPASAGKPGNGEE